MSRLAIALVALLACSMVAEIAAQKGFCRTSSYALPVGTVVANKKTMFGNCGANVEIVSQGTKGDCAILVQKVKNEAAWKAYSDCEKSGKNSGPYGPLKAKSDACKGNQKTGEC